MQSHTGCICWTFLQCVFSCVSSNYLPERMHSHTGCICSTFLQCVFSCVSSKRLHKRTHSHIGCICLPFLHCVFSSGSSNCQPERRHTCIGCTCLTSCPGNLLSHLQKLLHWHFIFHPTQNFKGLYTPFSEKGKTPNLCTSIWVLVFFINEKYESSPERKSESVFIVTLYHLFVSLKIK